MKYVVIAAACVALAGCATAVGRPTPLKVMVDAEAGYNVAAKAALRVCPRGHVPSATCTKVDDLRHRGLTAIKVARTAYRMGNSPDTGTIIELTRQLVQATEN